MVAKNLRAMVGESGMLNHSGNASRMLRQIESDSVDWISVELLKCYSNHDSRVRRLPDVLSSSQTVRSEAVQVTGRPRQRQTRLDPDQVDQLIEAYRAGSSVYELATRFEVNRRTVSIILKRSGVALRYNLLSPEQIVEASDLYAEGWSLARLGEHYGVNHSTVLNAFRKAGIPTRPRVW